MRVIQVSLRRFRGFEDLTVRSTGHVALVGEPRAGRSDLIEGLRRALFWEAVRYTTPTELDFWMLDTDEMAEVEVVLGGLGPVLEQEFVDHVERWGSEACELARPRSPTAPDSDETEWVVRLCYRAQWDSETEQASHWVDFPSEAEPSADTYARVPRRLHDLLPVVMVDGHGRPLRLVPRSEFRRLLESDPSNTLSTAFDDFVDSVADAGMSLAKTPDIQEGLSDVLDPIEATLGIDISDEDLVQFVPDDGSLSGLLRSLQPSVDLGPPGHLPLDRHGATTTAVIRAGEGIARLGEEGAVVLIDDFGEGLDPISARHIASIFRAKAGQVWLSTRRSSAVEAFPPEAIVRLHRKAGARQVAQIERPTSKAERLAARHLMLQLLPAASATTVAIVEGPHDRAALDGLAERRWSRREVLPPAAYGIAVIDAGVVDGSGGASAVARLAVLAKQLGFHTIAVIDGDPGTDGATALSAAKAAADLVVRLPDGYAIERAIMDGLDDVVVQSTLKVVCSAFNVAVPPGLASLTGSALLKAVISVLKKNGGLHAQFIEALPSSKLSRTLKSILRTIITGAREQLAGVQQL